MKSDPVIQRRGQAITAIRCLAKLAMTGDTRARAALEAWHTVKRVAPGASRTRRVKK